MNGTAAGKTMAEIEQFLYSAVISDILDELGYRSQACDAGIRPLDRHRKLAGRAFTALAAAVFEMPAEPYKLQMEAIDKMQDEQLFVVHTGAENAAFWGELLSTACRARGGRGAMIDGLNRDSSAILEMGFPVFSRGQRPVDSMGRVDVVAYGVPVSLGGVTVYPGDLVFGDMDGVVVVPQGVEHEVITRAFGKVSGENRVREALASGMSLSEAYRQFRIL